MSSFFELIIFVLVVGVIYQMFFSKKEMKQYDPREHEQPIYNKDNYITRPKEKDSYTPEPPTAEPKPFAETLPVEDKDKEKIEKDRTILGHDLSTMEEFYIKDKELNLMTLIVGATGAGKTVAIKNILEMPLKNNDPIILIDGKGDKGFAEDIKKRCEKYNRNFKLFTMDNELKSMNYNCLRHGGYTELKDKIMSIFDFSEEHYKLQGDRLLQGTFRLLLLPETKEVLQIKTVDLKILTDILDLETLASVTEAVGEKANFMIPIINEIESSAAKGLANRIKSISESELGHLFVDTADPNVIDLMQSIENDDVVLFSIDALKFPEYAKMFGRLVIADLKTVAPRFADKGKKIYSVFDEFNVFASEIIINLINKTRSFGFRNIMGTQELADMVVNGDDKLLKQIWGNTNVKIALRQDVPSSQEELSKGVSTKDVYKPTISISTSTGSEDINRSQSITLEEEEIFKAREFGQLGTGEAIVFIKVPDFRYGKIKVRMVF